MKAETVLRLVAASLQDLEPGIEPRWSFEGDCERIGLLDFLNAAISAIALYRPELFAVTETIRLEPGMRQKLPVSRKHGKAVMLIDITRNMGVAKPGTPVQSVNPDILTAWAQVWRTAEQIENWAYDRMTNPDYFLVWPAVSECGDVEVEAVFSVKPCPVQDPGQELPLADCFCQACVHHICAQIMAGDNDSSDYGKAIWHLQQFSSLLGIKNIVDLTWPKAKNSNVGGVA